MFIVATNKDNIRKKLPGAISVHKEGKDGSYDHIGDFDEVEMEGGCRIINNPDGAKQNGTTVWIEAPHVRIVR